MKSKAISTRRLAGVLTIAVLIAPSGALAQGESSRLSVTNVAVIGFDVVILRPLGFASLLIGGILFAPAALLTAANGRDSFDEARDVFIGPMVEDVFQRPLGEF